MSKAPSMPFFVDAYLADTMHLSEAEDGIYMRLLMCMWRMEGRLPDDDIRLARFVRVPKQRWCKKYRPVMSEFFHIEGGVWTQKRLIKEWNYVAEKIEKNRLNGRKGGRPKSFNPPVTEIPAKPVGLKSAKPALTTAITTQTQTQPHIHSDRDDRRSGPVDDLVFDLSKWIWHDGLIYLISQGVSQDRAASTLKQWLRYHSHAAVKNAISQAQVSAKNNPVAYIGKILLNGQNGSAVIARTADQDRVKAAMERVFGSKGRAVKITDAGS